MVVAWLGTLMLGRHRVLDGLVVLLEAHHHLDHLAIHYGVRHLLLTRHLLGLHGVIVRTHPQPVLLLPLLLLWQAIMLVTLRTDGCLHRRFLV